jgi:hypothetical protein
MTPEQEAAHKALAEAQARVAEADLTAELVAAKDAHRKHPTPATLAAKKEAVAAVIGQRDDSRKPDPRRGQGIVDGGTVGPAPVSNKPKVNKPRTPQ